MEIQSGKFGGGEEAEAKDGAKGGGVGGEGAMVTGWPEGSRVVSKFTTSIDWAERGWNRASLGERKDNLLVFHPRRSRPRDR